MLDKKVTEEVKVVLTDSINSNNATGGGDVHGASARSEVTINADVVVIAENVAEVLDVVKSAGDFKHEEKVRGESGK